MRQLPALLLLLLAACAAAPRAQPLAWQQALRDRTPREILVRRVWDDVVDRLEEAPHDGRVTHWVEVEILDDGRAPVYAVWPFDSLAVRRLPPRPGTTLIVAPCEWLQGRVR